MYTPFGFYLFACQFVHLHVIEWNDVYRFSSAITELPCKGVYIYIVRDSSAVRLAGSVGRQRALHKENSGFASPTLGRHISTFRAYRILFSIRNPYINRFINHFLFIHNHLTLRKWFETFLSNTFCIISFCSDLSCRWNCRIRLNVSSSMWFECCLRMQIMFQIITVLNFMLILC
jgi:hypothetical protein